MSVLLNEKYFYAKKLCTVTLYKLIFLNLVLEIYAFLISFDFITVCISTIIFVLNF